MEEEIKKLIKDALGNLAIEVGNFTIEHPEDLKNGDYSTNVALVIAKSVERNPQELAEKIVAEIIRLNIDKNIEKVEVAGAGFINFYLSRKFFSGSVEEILNIKDFGTNKIFASKKIMVEYTDPNPFKPFHIGHLMTNAIGESIARILEYSDADVSRANYQGDVGLHVAKAFYSMRKRGMPKDMDAPVSVLAQYIGESYAKGNEAYENDIKAKKEIEVLNKKIYDKNDEEINKVYNWGFKVTMEAFEDLYRILGTKFDFYFLESEVSLFGEQIVKDNIGRVFEKSDGAVVFKAEKHNPKLHTRVFITSEGLPTYEAKELGLTEEKFKVKPDMDLSLVVTANEQADYMKVVDKALSLIHPEYENKMLHITHGMMRLLARSRATAEELTSIKMSSRKGNVITGEKLIRDTIALIVEKMKDRSWNQEEKNKVAENVGVAAIKYSILRSKAGNDIVYNVEESISVEGDSGPYLQYSFARANSVIEKAQKENILPDFEKVPDEVSEVEKLLYRFPEVVSRSASLYEPHHIATYLIELARAFNNFYGHTLIVDKKDITSSYKIALTYAFSFVMKTGLHLLGIEAPKRM
ncbi:arginine--tRNA ligase [Candidatus Nomurabacteria bacterium RIFCSPLOWO2_01_FULL_39_17]|uniref:Arginine--tRNA ligase n=1 Tax=Candidatus Nomurabacteria bacterium RIFCSPLOWO2_01_FULL_39_17 TaxID=1801770 RepID=A0A1F6WW47_9BACT|nr:MAG: arginine--tRNA ligase [Candidatus Nomurabacteria bacterium RIFCSPLOWO2_01_FULL_39_17]